MVSRYISDDPIRGGKIRKTASAVDRIRKAHRRGEILTRERVLKEGERLDQIAGQVYGDGSLWWIIAATSEIGWFLQAPPGTILKVPVNLSDVLRYL